jgi:hypothetical protein
MKKLYIVLLFCGVFANMEAQSFTQNWKKLANGTDYPWFTADNSVITLAYNPATDKLLVAKRNDRIFIINPATGAQEDTLSTRGVGTEALKYNKIRVTSDGVIYAITLLATAGTVRIYRWASQNDTATLAATFPVTERTGDAFGLSGTGVNTILYASGAGTNPASTGPFSIYILTTTDGRTFTRESKVTITTPTAGQQWANRAVEPEGTGINSPIWIKGGGFNARRITVGAKTDSLRVGTLVATVPDGTSAGEASVGFGGMRMLTTPNGTRFLCFSGGNNQYAGTKLHAITVARDTVFNLFGRDSVTAQSAYVTNTNGTGDVSFKVNANGTFTVFYLGTNNGIAAATSRAFTSTKDVATTGFSVQTMGNPIYEALNLQINSNALRTVSVNVYNAVGSLLTTQKVQLTEGVNSVNLAASNLPSGLLFVEVSDGVGRQMVKVLKQE